MDRNSDEKILVLERGILNVTIGENLVHDEQIGDDHAGEVASEDPAEVSQVDSLPRSAPATPTDRTPISLCDLAESLSEQFERSGRREDLETAITLQRQALELRPVSHPHRRISLANLALDLSSLFELSGRGDDLEEAILLHQEALELLPTPHPDRWISLSNLANTLRKRFRQLGRREDLEETILLHRQALELVPASHRYRSITNLALALRTQFDQWGRREDLEEAILLNRQTLELISVSHPDRSKPVGNLANALLTRFAQSGGRDDLEEAVSLLRHALELVPTSHPQRSTPLSDLASALRARYTQLGGRDDLEEAILLDRQVLEMLPASHPRLSLGLYRLANSLWIRFSGQSGRWDDLDEAISLYRQALELLPASHPQRSMSLGNLGSALSTRFTLSGGRDDLEDAVLLYRRALELLPTSHPHLPMSLNNLANALWTRFVDHSDRRDDLQEAISLHRQAQKLLPASHPQRFLSLSSLSLALSTQFQKYGRQEDLEEAIVLDRQALELPPASHPDRSKNLNSLSNTLLLRFKQSGRFEDLEEAIDLSGQSLNALVSGHPSTCLYSGNQGDVFFVAYTHTNRSEYLHKAMDSFRAAVTCEAAPVRLRFRFAKEWASLADSRHDSALDAYRAAIQLLPRLAMLGLDLSSRQQALTSGSDGLARAAAACAIRYGQYGKAVELLEEGRGVFWSQALQLRTPMADLRDVAPELEEKLRRISLSLEQGSLRDVSRSLSDDTPRVMSMEQEASHFRLLNDEWLEAVEEVRLLEGFQDFLRPSRISTLLGAADKDPLVILNACDTGCAALILSSTGVQHVPFPDLTFAHVTRLVEILQMATVPGLRDISLSEPDLALLVHQEPYLSHSLEPLRETFARGGISRVSLSDLIFPYSLAIIWKVVVEPVVRQLGLEKSDIPSSLRWCPTGPFAFLPIHAAGVYDTNEPECVFDYVVSSYTPTISALLRDNPLPSAPFKMVVVIQPELPYTVDELHRIEARVPVTRDQAPITELVRLISGTVEEVTSHLPTTSIVHFACHGTQHAQKPLESALLLQGGRPLTVHRIMQQSSPNAMLAFLAACQTGMGDKTLPDEVIHLGSTLLFAGFRGVVATMWNIYDVDGPEVADSFYEYLFEERVSNTEETFLPDSTRAARALHLAVAKLRSDRNVSFVRWVPFIHLGR